ncbi:DUF1793-domain-containing protein [Dacryopinax primogenitus]|uniref:DUF1793-domain-containing protein n=1 Tax=Dacryopinax primogenitus (strain DJM 731) TaxID=1858805 RepID=M5FWY9_DACPD|nr:DUF1793-domain-containing protein [Dacryopinax primogenitus]EJU00939.1 DUF1793-domain-containing protein [Dacryopinax primogenitus]
MTQTCILAFLSALTVVVAISWTATPFNPLSIPLAVRSPSLSCWLPGGNDGGNLAGQWPEFWTGATLGWAGYVRVDNTTYVYMGAPSVPNLSPPLATQTNFAFTSTQSIFKLNAGPITLPASFLSPIEPNDLLRQSLPFSYLAISVESNDGAPHSVQIYSDISAEWVSGDDALVASWSTHTGDIMTHQVQLRTQELFSEVNEHTQYGAAYYSVASGGTYQTGADVNVRTQFINNGKLTNTEDTNYRAVDQNWPVFGHAFDLGSVRAATAPIVFSIGHARDPALQYIVMNDASKMAYSMLLRFSSGITLVHSPPPMPSTLTYTPMRVQSPRTTQPSSLSPPVKPLVLELTIGTSSDDILMFMKEISSDGNVNTVDVIFPAYPIFLYTNPALARYLLEPLFQYQNTGQSPNKWSGHDMGSHYPNATGHNDGSDEAMPVEESGNMVIMSAAYMKATGDSALGSSYYNLLQQWTSFLINDSLIPANQISTDDFAGALANQTNLAIKGIVGIAGMSQIASALGKTVDAQYYSSIAQSYVPLFEGFATSKDGSHLDLSYGNDSSWGITYNLYADKLLQANLFPDHLYEMQTDWYPTVKQPYGIPLDTRHLYTKTDWQIFMSAGVTSNSTRDLFIESVASFQKGGLTNEPFPDLYDTNTGEQDVIQFKARPVVGGHFAHLALKAL